MRAVFCLIAMISLAGCLASPDWHDPWAMNDKVEPDTSDQQPMIFNGLQYTPDSRDRARYLAEMQQSPGFNYWRQPANQYQADYLHKSLADYAEQIAMQLVKHSHGMTNHSRIGVSSFVTLDSSLQNTSVVGNQLSEYLMVQLQQFGLSVVDFKLKDTIAVGRHGDLVFSRDAYDLSDELVLDYVLTGTMIESAKGITVNARIANLQQKNLTSSATIQIPRFVVEQLLPATYLPAG